MKFLSNLAAALAASAIVVPLVLTLLLSIFIYISYGWDGFKMLPQFFELVK